jgi:hypothetical protein
MKIRQIALRWVPTFLAYPLSGLLVTLAHGPIQNVLSALISGAMVGCALGLAQWWALKPLSITFDWAWSTAVALAIASPVAWAVVSYSTSIAALATWGLISGGILGLGQALSQRLGPLKSVYWTALVATAWSLGWFISANVIVDAEASYAVFGSTGALAATLLLSFAINPIFRKKS